MTMTKRHRPTITGIIAALVLTFAVATAEAQDENQTNWQYGSTRSAKTACEKIRNVSFIGLKPKRFYRCTDFKPHCAWAGVPYVRTMGECMVTWKMEYRFIGGWDFECMIYGRWKGIVRVKQSRPVCDPIPGR